MNELNPPDELQPAGDNNHNPLLAAIAFVYAIVVGTLLTVFFVTTALQELAPLARVVGLGCYGLAAVGAWLHIAIGSGLLSGARWLDPLIRGTTTAIVIPLVLAAAYFLVLPFAADLNHWLWSVVSLVVGVPWPLYLNFTQQYRQ